jgi:hypothetical protein
MIERSVVVPAAVIICVLLVGCQQGQDENSATKMPDTAAVSGESTSVIDEGLARSPGKPTAPVSIRYNIIGSAVVGQPVSVNLEIDSSEPDQPVTMQYRINDSSALLFAESQPQRVDLGAAPDAGPLLQQVTVIPQREGRLYLNVSAEVETVNGTMFRSLAVPIQVGTRKTAPTVNGELQETADGEAVISMPAEESAET